VVSRPDRVSPGLQRRGLAPWPRDNHLSGEQQPCHCRCRGDRDAAPHAPCRTGMCPAPHGCGCRLPPLPASIGPSCIRIRRGRHHSGTHPPAEIRWRLQPVRYSGSPSNRTVTTTSSYLSTPLETRGSGRVPATSSLLQTAVMPRWQQGCRGSQRNLSPAHQPRGGQGEVCAMGPLL
jgi:hypothetical protein